MILCVCVCLSEVYIDKLSLPDIVLPTCTVLSQQFINYDFMADLAHMKHTGHTLNYTQSRVYTFIHVSYIAHHISTSLLSPHMQSKL